MKTKREKIPEELYKTILKSVPIVCADIIAASGRKFLLVKRNNNPEKGKWWFPGGRVWKGEKLVSAAKRILKSETGLAAGKINLLGIHEYFPSGRGRFSGIKEHEIVGVFLAEVRRGKVSLDAQSSDFKWFGKAMRSWPPYVRASLEDAIACGRFTSRRKYSRRVCHFPANIL